MVVANDLELASGIGSACLPGIDCYLRNDSCSGLTGRLHEIATVLYSVVAPARGPAFVLELAGNGAGDGIAVGGRDRDMEAVIVGPVAGVLGHGAGLHGDHEIRRVGLGDGQRGAADVEVRARAVDRERLAAFDDRVVPGCEGKGRRAVGLVGGDRQAEVGNRAVVGARLRAVAGLAHRYRERASRSAGALGAGRDGDGLGAGLFAGAGRAQRQGHVVVEQRQAAVGDRAPRDAAGEGNRLVVLQGRVVDRRDLKRPRATLRPRGDGNGEVGHGLVVGALDRGVSVLAHRNRHRRGPLRRVGRSRRHGDRLRAAPLVHRRGRGEGDDRAVGEPEGRAVDAGAQRPAVDGALDVTRHRDPLVRLEVGVDHRGDTEGAGAVALSLRDSDVEVAHVLVVGALDGEVVALADLDIEGAGFGELRVVGHRRGHGDVPGATDLRHAGRTDAQVVLVVVVDPDGNGVHGLVERDPDAHPAEPELGGPLERELEVLGAFRPLVVVDAEAEALDACVARPELRLPVEEIVVPFSARSPGGGGGPGGPELGDRARADGAGARAAGDLEELEAQRGVGGLRDPLGDDALVLHPPEHGILGGIDRDGFAVVHDLAVRGDGARQRQEASQRCQQGHNPG